MSDVGGAPKTVIKITSLRGLHALLDKTGPWTDGFEIGFIEGAVHAVERLHSLLRLPDETVEPKTKDVIRALLIIMRHDLTAETFPQMPTGVEFFKNRDLFKFLDEGGGHADGRDQGQREDDRAGQGAERGRS